MTGTGLPAMQRLLDVLARIGPMAIAVSGGVDSTTLAVIAHRRDASAVDIIHAVSAAVPNASTARVRRYAEREGWRLCLLDGGEFADARYRANPIDRCYYCKAHLYAAMAQVSSLQLVSGTNLDDLGDYRPGLKSAKIANVRSPFVEAGIGKSEIYDLAHDCGLDDLAHLPASPCLASRVETGIAIDPDVLLRIDAIETALRQWLAPQTVRCRLRRDGVVVELDEASLIALSPDHRRQVSQTVAQHASQAMLSGGVRIDRYRMGGAFVGHKDVNCINGDTI